MFYTTNFPLTESPISGWVRGFTEGLDWTDPQTGPNDAASGQIAFGTQTIHTFPPADDSIGHLLGFAPDHYAEGVSYNNVLQQIEVELFLRLTIGPHSARGYELDYVISSGNLVNLTITRWNGALNDFTVLNGGNPVVSNLDTSTGSVHRGTIKGNVITVTRNGSVVATYDLAANFVADGSVLITTGQPGMGFWDASLSTSGARNTFGWSRFTADDGVGILDEDPEWIQTVQPA